MAQEGTNIGFEDHAAEVRPGEDLDLARLRPFLRSHFPEAEGLLTVQQFPSGHSNLTYFVSLAEKEMQLRRHPYVIKEKAELDMGREFRVLSKLHSVYPAPQALLYCDDASILGAPFYLMERIHGIILRRELPAGLQIPAEKARQLDESFIDNLARLHSLDYAAIGLGDLGKPQGYLERQARRSVASYHGSPNHPPP